MRPESGPTLLSPASSPLSACATTPAAGAARRLYVVRHLHTPAGERDPDLTAEGQRAGGLARRLVRAGARRPARSTSATTSAPARPRRRSPARLGLTPIVYDPADTPALVARVRAGPGPALIVGHSNTVPDIVEQLGGTRPGPMVHEDFGDIWRIGPDGATVRSRIAER